jgi:hypothetical protein
MAELKQFLLEKGKNNPAQSWACQNKAVSKNEIKENPVTALKQPVQQNAIYKFATCPTMMKNRCSSNKLFSFLLSHSLIFNQFSQVYKHPTINSLFFQFY